MFAVPGWKVTADRISTEPAEAPSNESKKRKRPTGQNDNVTSENVADLWAKVIEKRKPKNSDTKRSRRDRKRNKREEQGSEHVVEQEDEDGGKAATKAASPLDSQVADEPGKKKKRNKNKAKMDKPSNVDGDGEDPKIEATKPTKTKPAKQANIPPPVPQPSAKLTPLQASMREKLISARFRHLNETLYTKPSTDAYQLFADSPEMFQEYHEGFRRQVEVWPENPVDGYIDDIKKRAKITPPPKGQPQPAGALAALPRTQGTCTVADLGCGDARLAASLESAKKKLQLRILSYDLQSGSVAHVTRADIANLPLGDGDVNVVIFCLALMGTNWLDFVEEAYRILHWKGELWVAEIKSRFSTASSKRKPVEHSVGNRKKTASGKKGKNSGEKNEEDGADLAVEVDGVQDKRNETDVSAFVEALKRRGFLLNGEAAQAVDVGNKMFVKMRFLKAAAPTRGKGVTEAKNRGHPLSKKKSLAITDSEDKVDELNILKPCVYKLR